MERSISFSRIFLAYAWLVLALAVLYFLSTHPSFFDTNSFFAIAISLDFVAVVPLIYLLLIWKTKVPNVTIVPVFALCMTVAFNVLPVEYQGTISWVELWIVPMVELGVISFVGYKFYQIRKAYKAETGQAKQDVYDSMSLACERAFPGLAGRLLGSELSMLYYGFFAWRKPKYKHNEYSIHQQSGVLVILAFIIGLVVAETAVLHLLVQRWSTVAAWVLTILSVYSGLQVFGFLKSIPRRPLQVAEEALRLRFGIMSSAEVSYDQIASIEIFKKELPEDSNIAELSPLGMLGGGHNVRIQTNSEQQLEKLFGMKQRFNELVLFVDEPERFVSEVQKKAGL